MIGILNMLLWGYSIDDEVMVWIMAWHKIAKLFSKHIRICENIIVKFRNISNQV